MPETRQFTGTLRLRGLRLQCLIGIDAAEKHARQTLILDADITPQPSEDGIAVDYAKLTKRLQEWSHTARHDLVEDFTAAAADLILAEFKAASARVYCRKPKPLPGLDEFGAEITRTS